MAWTCKTEIEEALWEAAREALPSSALKAAALTQAIVDRSRVYTSERERLVAPGAGEREPADLAARAVFFTVADAPKIAVPLAELGRRGLLPAPGERARILDLGAGVGAMTLGAIAALEGRRFEVRAIDADARALELFGLAFRGATERLGVEGALVREATEVSRAELGRGAHDLVFVGNLLNELPSRERLPLLSRALEALGPGGAVIVVEPALRDTARELHRLRDRVLEDGAATVFAPCTRRAIPCPMLADPDDWCHEDRATALPPRAARLSASTGLRERGLKFAYLVLRRGDEPLVETSGDPRAAWRVVSRSRKLKGLRECFACGEAGRVRLRLLKRRRSAENRGFESCQRGDVLLYDGPPDLSSDAPVTTLSLKNSNVKEDVEP